MTDRWEGIESFVTVAEHGSFTRAATLLSISISQVSREISRLEARLGVQLLARTTRSLSLTEAGRLFEQRCRRLILDRDDAFAAFTANDHVVKGHVRLTCPVAYGEQAILPIINRFLAQYAEVSAYVELDNHMLDIVSEGFDMAIRVGAQPDPRFVRTVLSSRTLHCCASPAYLARRGSPRSIAELDQHECLRGSAPNWRFSSEGRNLLVTPHARWRCNSGFAVAQAALDGLGLCQLPDFYVASHLLSGALVEILPEARPPNQEIVAVYPNKARTPAALVTLVDFIRAELAKSGEEQRAIAS